MSSSSSGIIYYIIIKVFKYEKKGLYLKNKI